MTEKKKRKAIITGHTKADFTVMELTKKDYISAIELYKRPEIEDLYKAWGIWSLHSKHWDRLNKILPDSFNGCSNVKSEAKSVISSKSEDHQRDSDAGILLHGNKKKKRNSSEYGYAISAGVINLLECLLSDEPIIYTDGSSKLCIVSMLDNIKQNLIKNNMTPLTAENDLFTKYLVRLKEKAKLNTAGALFLVVAKQVDLLVDASKYNETSTDSLTYAFFLLILTSWYINADLNRLDKFFSYDTIQAVIKDGISGVVSSVFSERPPKVIAVANPYDDMQSTIRDNLKELFKEKDEYLGDARDIVSETSTLQSVEKFFEKVKKDIPNYKSNYDALIKKYDFILEKITEYNSEYQIIGDTWTAVKKKYEIHNHTLSVRLVDIVLSDLRNIADDIGLQAERMFPETSEEEKEINVLLPSVSSQVIDYIKGMYTITLERINLYVCECRPKNVNADSTLARLQAVMGRTNPFNSITIITDNGALNMIHRKKIDLVLYGASSILLDKDDAPRWMTNSCGTESVMLVAKERNVQVYVIADKSKYKKVDYKDDQPVYTMEYIDEPGTFDAHIKKSAWKYEQKNTRRDFSRLHSGTILVNESDIIKVGMDNVPPIKVYNRQNEGEFIIK